MAVPAIPSDDDSLLWSRIEELQYERRLLGKAQESVTQDLQVALDLYGQGGDPTMDVMKTPWRLELCPEQGGIVTVFPEQARRDLAELELKGMLPLPDLNVHKLRELRHQAQMMSQISKVDLQQSNLADVIPIPERSCQHLDQEPSWQAEEFGRDAQGRMNNLQDQLQMMKRVHGEQLKKLQKKDVVEAGIWTPLAGMQQRVRFSEERVENANGHGPRQHLDLEVARSSLIQVMRQMEAQERVTAATPGEVKESAAHSAGYKPDQLQLHDMVAREMDIVMREMDARERIVTETAANAPCTPILRPMTIQDKVLSTKGIPYDAESVEGNSSIITNEPSWAIRSNEALTTGHVNLAQVALSPRQMSQVDFKQVPCAGTGPSQTRHNMSWVDLNQMQYVSQAFVYAPIPAAPSAPPPGYAAVPVRRSSSAGRLSSGAPLPQQLGRPAFTVQGQPSSTVRLRPAAPTWSAQRASTASRSAAGFMASQQHFQFEAANTASSATSMLQTSFSVASPRACTPDPKPLAYAATPLRYAVDSRSNLTTPLRT